MKAMILAAGLGTRLRPMTNDRPKALVEVGGRTLLEMTLERLREFGVREVIINVHHFAGMVVDYLKAHDNFAMRIEISREDELLDTGGGLKKAAWFFLKDCSGKDEPFILHNVDVISTIDLNRMVEFHTKQHALATLAVRERPSSRHLLFDKEGRFCGRQTGAESKPEMIRSAGTTDALAFSGIHVISSRLLELLAEPGAFSIITSYVRLAATGEKILAFRADQWYWRDLGKPEDLARAAQDIKDGTLENNQPNLGASTPVSC
jgi:mannose-1-phosphate guanylyltransferase